MDKEKIIKNSSTEDIKKSDTSKKIAVILIRGLCKVRKDIKDSIIYLNLHRKNYCAIVVNTKDNLGMINKAKDYLTWGEIDLDTYKELLEKRSEKDKDGNVKKFFRLHPPRGGFERKGIKKNVVEGGALGYRGEKINDLIKKML
ncbi:MAG: uL30 family ribosomal protein [Candidatus Woesearchaeota archaeon]